MDSYGDTFSFKHTIGRIGMFNSKRIQEVEDDLEAVLISVRELERKVASQESTLFKIAAGLQTMQNLILGRRKKK